MPLKREREFELLGQIKVTTTLEDMFNSLMHDNPTREECREIISETIYQWVDREERDALMDIIKERI